MMEPFLILAVVSIGGFGLSTTIPSTPLCYQYDRNACEKAAAKDRERLCKPVKVLCASSEITYSGCMSIWKQQANDSLPSHTDTSLNNTMRLGCSDVQLWNSHACNSSNCVADRIVYEHSDGETVSVTCCCTDPYCNIPDGRLLNLTEVEPTETGCRTGNCGVTRGSRARILRHGLTIAGVIGAVGTIALIIVTIVVRRKHAKSSYREDAISLEPCDAEDDESLLSAHLSLQREIAKGLYANVYYAGEVNSVPVVIKCFTAAYKKMWQRERDIYRTPGMARSDNIARFFGATRAGSGNNMTMWIVIQYYANGSIYDYLKGHILTWPIMLKIAHSMMKGLAYLHSELGEDGAHRRSLAHRDIKSKNILIKDDMTAAIADFGLAQYFKDGYVNESDAQFQAGTHRYMAPEVLDGAISFTKDAFLRIDVYAAALVMWELVTRCEVSQNRSLEYKAPYEEMGIGNCAQLESLHVIVCKERKRPSFPACLQNDTHALSLQTTIEEAWDADAEARLSAGCIESRLQTLIATSERNGTELNNMRNLQPPPYEVTDELDVPLIPYAHNP